MRLLTGVTQALRQFGCDLDAGQAGADHDRSELAGRCRQATQALDMFSKARRGGVRVDVERMLGESTSHRRRDNNRRAGFEETVTLPWKVNVVGHGSNGPQHSARREAGQG